MAQTSTFLSVFLEPQASWPCFVERAFCAISVPDDSDSDADVGTEGQTFGPVGQHSRCPTIPPQYNLFSSSSSRI